MADDIEIGVGARDDATAVLLRIEQVLIKTTDTVKRSTQESESAWKKFNNTIKSSWTEIQSGIAVLTRAFGAVKQIVNELIGSTIKYANEVRSLKQISGESAEATSILIQVADDYKITSGDLMMAQRRLAREGMTLNIDTVIKLASEYQKLNTGAERQAFLTEKLGRSSQEWAEILSQTPDAIRARAAAIDAALIMDEKALKAARDYEFALDDLNDSYEALKNTIGVGLVPSMTLMINKVNEGFQAWKSLGEMMPSIVANYERLAAVGKTGNLSVMDKLVYLLAKAPLSSQELANKILGNKNAIDSATQSYMGMAEAAGMASQAELAAARAGPGGDLGEGGDGQGQEAKLNFIVQYAAAYDEYAKKRAEILRQIADAEARGYENLGRSGTKIYDLKASLKELDDQAKKSASSLMLSLMQIAMAADGVITDAEIQAYLDMAVSMGIMTRAAAAAALAQWDLYNATVAANLAIANSPIPPGGGGGGGTGTGTTPGGAESQAFGGWGRGWMLVGDKPGGRIVPGVSELVYAPGGARVYNAAQTAAMLGGGRPQSYAGGGYSPPALPGDYIIYGDVYVESPGDGRDLLAELRT